MSFFGGRQACWLTVIVWTMPALHGQERVSQGPPQDAAALSTIRVDVNVINVVCTVRNLVGSYVTDLDKRNFTLIEDGKPQTIRYFARDADTPITVALLLDLSNSVTHVLDAEKIAASRFTIEVLRPTDRALLVGFSHTIAVLQDSTSSVKSLLAALKSAQPFPDQLPPVYDSHGGTLLYEAVQRVCAERLAGVAGRKALVIVSDGVDNGSRVSALDAMRAAQQSDTIIYGIHYASIPSESSDGETALERLSEPTGGRSFHVLRTGMLESIFSAITEDMRSQYSLGYVSDNRTRDGHFRKLKLKVNRAGLKVQARQGYYAAN